MANSILTHALFFASCFIISCFVASETTIASCLVVSEATFAAAAAWMAVANMKVTIGIVIFSCMAVGVSRGCAIDASCEATTA